jgi:hypothetical protein
MPLQTYLKFPSDDCSMQLHGQSPRKSMESQPNRGAHPMKRNVLFFLLFIGTAIIVTNVLAQDSREVTKTVALNAKGEVVIDTYKGSITITTWDKPQVEIHARIEADDEFDTKYSAEKVRDTEVRIDASDNRVSVKTDYENIHERRNHFFSWFEDVGGSLPLVHYTISMPVTANLSIKDYKSNSSVKRLRSHLDFNTYKGNVEISELDGSIKFETYKGEARINVAKLADRSRFETYKGKVTIELPKNTGFDLDADLEYRSDFSTDFGVELTSHGKHHHNAEFHGPVNGGGPAIILRSTKGDIRLRER